jgi:hypothetical protein
LKVNDGQVTVSKGSVIIIMPYKPELAAAKFKSIIASSYSASDYPNNVSDGNFSTMWSAQGDNQWLLFKINHLSISFSPGQKYSSYFDIYASKDNLLWEQIMTQVNSCSFSGDIQVFDFPALNTNTEYSYLKLIGHGNSLNNWNNISEFKVFGEPYQYPDTGNTEKTGIVIYPNPAKDILTISNEEPAIKTDKVRIIDLSGKIVLEEVLNPDNKTIQLPISLNSGVYIVQLGIGNLILFAQKLIVIN